MNQPYIDAKLEKYISKIKTCKKSDTRLRNYERSVNRINKLKKEYNNLCELFDSPVKQNLDKINVDDIISRLDDISENMENNSCSMLDLIKNYKNYQSLLSGLNSEVEKIKNKIYTIEEAKEDIIIKPYDVNLEEKIDK